MSHRQFIPHLKPAHLWVSMVLAFCTGTQFAHAVSLGRFDLKSDRGQALVAELEIVAAKEEELRTLKIGVAPAQTYRQHWLELHPEILGTKFILKRNPQGRYVVQIQGSEPITRPWLDLLLVVSWSDQQRIHEYSVRFPSADSTPDLAGALVKLPPLVQPPAPSATAAGKIGSEKREQEPPQASAATAPAEPVALIAAAQPISSAPAGTSPAGDQAVGAQVAPALASPVAPSEASIQNTARLTAHDVPFSDPPLAESDMQLGSLEDMIRIFNTPNRSTEQQAATQLENASSDGSRAASLTKPASEDTKAESAPSVQLDKETFSTYKQLLANSAALERSKNENAQQLQGKIRIETKKRGTSPSRLALSSPADSKVAALAMREQDADNASIVSSMQRNIDDIKNLQALATNDIQDTPATAGVSASPKNLETASNLPSLENTALPVPVSNPAADQPAPLAASGIPNDGGMFGRFRSEIRSVLFAAFIVFIPIFILFRSARSVDQTRSKKGSRKSKTAFQNILAAFRFSSKKDDDDGYTKPKRAPAPAKPPTVTERVGGLDLSLDSPPIPTESSKAH
jgi:hypothetical protein